MLSPGPSNPGPLFAAADVKPGGGDFDRLFKDHERFALRSLPLKVLHDPDTDALSLAEQPDRGDLRFFSGQVRGDRAQLAVVLTNFLENAGVHGGVAQVRAFVERQRTGFEVVDDGPGISASNLEHVFDRFFTTNRSGGSSGLGLALVRAIVFTHHGEVTVRSRPGETVFRVELPMDSRRP